MDQETIQKIAAEVALHLPSYPWALLLLQVVLTLAAAGLGAFLGEYLKTRGKNLATKADFESLKDQLRANTELVETIKAEVGHKDWARREWTNVRRTKLEALLNKMHDCHAYLERHSVKAVHGEAVEEPSPHGELDTIVTLYFPQLRSEVDGYLAVYEKEIKAGLALAKQACIGGGIASQKAFDEYQAQSGGPELHVAFTAMGLPHVDCW